MAGEINNIKDEFIRYATQYGISHMNGEHKTTNLYHKKLMRLYKKNENLNNALYIELIEYPNEYVQLWSATFMLRNNEKLAKNKLDILVSLQKPISSMAELVLFLWNKNELDI